MLFTKKIFTEGRIILADEHVEPNNVQAIRALDTINSKETIFLFAEELAVGLENFLVSFTNNNQALFVFPGNGSNFPKSFSPICKQQKGISVFAKRLWMPGSSPIVRAGAIMPEIFIILGVKNVLVIDDVISSGRTMHKIYLNNAWRIPSAAWIGACWLAQMPEMKSASGVKGYEQVFCSCLVEGPNKRKVPINSLSTLRQDKTIAKDYAKRHFCQPELFLHLISL